MPGLVLVHGVSPGGPADPRRQGHGDRARTVWGGRLSPPRSDWESSGWTGPILPASARAIDYLYDKTGEKVMVLAFSFGAAFTLVAIEEEP